MANQEHQEMLKKGVARWNQWRDENRDVKIDLTGIEIARLQLSGYNLRHADFSNSTFDGNASLMGAMLNNATFNGTSFQGTPLHEAILEDATFDGATFDFSAVRDAKIAGAKFYNCHLHGIKFLKCDFSAVEFHGSTLDSVVFDGNSNLAHTDFSKCKGFQKINFSNCSLIGANFSGTKFKNSEFRSSELTSTDFSMTEMTECTFQNIVMPEDASPSPSDAPIFAESKFQQTKFVSTVFVETDFTNVEFDDCDFGNRLFRRCNFRSAKFRFKENVLARLYFIECDLAYAKFNEAFLDQSKFDGCEFEGTDFNRCRMDRVSFKDAKNLHKIRGSISCLIQSDNSGRPEDVIDFDRYEPPWHVRWFTWEFLRKFGQIPLFGVSYSIITVMILATWGLQRLNEFVSHAQIWVEKTAQVPEEWVKLTGDVLREGLTGLVLGRQSVALFVGAVCLAIASTIYALACDNRIKEYSKDAWTIIHGKSSFHYLPLSWQFWYLRWPCALLYIFGGLLVLAVLAFRIVQVFSYMLQQI